ncbi:MAG: cytochrome c-type biogenesis protein CcmH [Deltaproteobacteria bacterium]|nr:cytochrome c-type biogenesis protein CcmH [Deltaproteobacteria bacterium]
MGNKKKRKFCPQCGNAMRASDQYCGACGLKAAQDSGIRPKIKKNQNWIWITASVAAAAVLITIVVSGMISGKEKAIYSAHNTAQIQSIISAFDCSCGQCDKTLKDCDCPTAKEMNEYIAKAVAREKYSRKEIIRMVNDRYGHLINKAELQS